ncbi:hypothetical protein SAMD00019534_115800 [Acytostelium subglobosum LB1]|uniref:hypothetical protein n=1 Tax=Acytostelium subglobosum LB1 TaxID=1410327 RepID=UPI000644CC20|nr:hypothetical protein SAMD00019534_115800 [Acytostelium subglobosum LB1]GAM28404.1 hypothetical protein SAMD00019534_115800 [Acytostelium subglobosum LB1]|eukprot:XP_012748721.1 hypothetical protein SAMD00019534_115800 [Acytostelium subglobosum LB1]
MMIYRNEAVYVTNLSKNANEKTIRDFFSFCGKIVELRVTENKNGETNDAVVIFETEAAAKTALLLQDALVSDRAIRVVPYTDAPDTHIPASESAAQDHNTNDDQSTDTAPLLTKESDNNNNNNNNNQNDFEKSLTSAFASIFAAGYSVGQEVAAKAKQIDEENLISLKLKVGAENLKVKANELDSKLQLSEKTTAVKVAVTEKAKDLNISENASAIKSTVVENLTAIDERLQLSDMFKSATDLISQHIMSLAARAQQNPTISKGVEMVGNIGTGIKDTANNISQTVENQFAVLSTETNRIVEEKQREKQESQGESQPLLNGEDQPTSAINAEVEEHATEEQPAPVSTTQTVTPQPSLL